MTDTSDIERAIYGLHKEIDVLSGAIYTTTENLKIPIQNLATIFDTSSKKTEKLTKALVRWTRIMAIAIIIQAIAVIGQIVVIIWANLK
jgi:nitrate reductase beta subunit